MFIYLNKKIKIAIPDPIDVNALAWNQEEGWIVVGGEQGLLKVLKLDDVTSREGASGSGNLLMNQNLSGHKGAVQVVTWNEQYRRLTTSDSTGLIIVWMLWKGKWYEEMVNNRNVSVVKDMEWNADGQKICIIYEDGMVIVGGVDGTRLWGNDLKMNLVQVAWSPDGKKILFGTDQGKVHIYDNIGTAIAEINILCLEGCTEIPMLTSIDWYSGAFGYVEDNCPTLCICFENGRLQIMRSDTDNEPILIDAEMKVVACKWNQHGTVLAIAGSESVQTDDETESVNVLQFYTPMGENLRTLKIPGNELRSLSWEGGGLRLTLAVDHFIYFANVRPDYKWGYFTDTVVYAFTKPERAEHCVIFWDTKLNGHQVKYVKALLDIKACGEYCVLATRADDDPNQFVLILCNAIGHPVDNKYIDIEPVFLHMTKTHIIVASHECVYIWAYAQGRSAEQTGKQNLKDERIFHVDDSPSSAKDTMSKFKKADVEAMDPVSCLTASETMLVVGKESGTLQEYSLPGLALGSKHVLDCRPDRIALNCNSTRVSIIDISGILTLYDLTAKRLDPETGHTTSGARIAGFERKDVWDFRWAEDNPLLFAMMERTYMYIFRDTDPEEPFFNNGWICQFNDLQVRSVQLDMVFRDPEHPTKGCIIDVESKSLRDTRGLLGPKVKISDVASFIEDNPHPRLWRLLAEFALRQLDLNIAERGFVRCQDYAGIEFVNKLRRLDDDSKQQAEVAVYFNQFEVAERIYHKMERSDLTKQMRVKLGDWFRVIKLLNSGGAAPDMKVMMQAWDRIGDYYADRLKWQQAATYYTRGSNKQRLAECYYMTENYTDLESMIYQLHGNDTLLPEIAAMFASVGLCEQAVEAYDRCARHQDAVDTCVRLNQWDLAVDLARKHHVADVEAVFAKYASHLLDKGQTMEAIELYTKAKQHLEAARLFYTLAAEHRANPMRAKKLYVLGALQVEEYRLQSRSTSTDPTRSALDGLLAEDCTTQAQTRMIDGAWRGAEAYHFLMLAQRQLYAGQYVAALATAQALTEYDDLLDPVQAYSIFALAAVANKNYGLCSKAFTRLESLPALTDKQRDAYETLALAIFTKHPKGPAADDLVVHWKHSFQKCSVVTGRAVVEPEFWICGTCQHRAGVEEIPSLATCPLCHAPL